MANWRKTPIAAIPPSFALSVPCFCEGRLGYDTKTEITGHGFRAMARTILHEVHGISPDVIEHQLAHKVSDALGTSYNRTKFLPARKAMMQEWAGYLEKPKAGAEVIPINGHAA